MMNFFSGDSPEQQVERLLAQGERLFQHGKEHEGLEKFVEAAEILPEAPKPSLYLGRAYCKRQEYELALKHYYKGLYFCKINDEPGILCEIAQVYLHQQQYDIAEEKLQKALQLDPDFLLAQRGLIHIYLHTGRISDALELQQLFLQQAPEDIQLVRQVAESHRRLGEYHKAQSVLQHTREKLKSSKQYTELKRLEYQIREFSFPDGTEFGIKELFYARYGSICLGTAGDNGLVLQISETRIFSTFEVFITLQRLIAFIRSFSWGITCVVTGDNNSEILASVLAELLTVPLKPVSKVHKNEVVLVCQCCLQESKGIRKLLRKLGRRSQNVLTFVFLSELDSEEHGYIPDISGITLEKEACVSWKNADGRTIHSYHESEFWGMPSGISDMVMGHYVDKFYELPEEENIRRQIIYYQRETSLLREHLVPPENGPADLTLEKKLKGLLSSRKSEIYATLSCLQNEDLHTLEVVSALKTLYLERSEPVARRMIGNHLLNMEDDTGLLYLLSLFYDSEDDVLLRISLLKTVSLSSKRKISDAILTALQSSHEELRLCATRYFGRLDQSQHLPPLFDTLLTDSPEIILHSIHYLTKQRSQLLRKHFPRLLQHETIDVIHTTLTAIQQFQDYSCVEDVLRLLSHDDAQIIEHAIQTIACIGDMGSDYQLLSFLEHENPALRYVAAESLTKLEYQRSIVFLMERLRKESLDVQEKLLKLLGEVGLQETVPFIIQFADQHPENLSITLAAMKTLATLQNPRSLAFARKAVSKFPNEEMLSCYISIVATVGEEKDVETLITFLGHPPVIRLRVAGVVYRKGLEHYFHILQDGIRSKKLAVNLITLDVLVDIGDELSVALIFSAFKKGSVVLDRRIVAAISQHRNNSQYLRLFQAMPSFEREAVFQGIQRAIYSSRSLEEVLDGFEVYYLFWDTAAISTIRELVTQSPNSLVRCGAMRWLAKYDADRSLALIQNQLTDDDIDVANTAYLLLEELEYPVKPYETFDTREVSF